MAIAAGNQVLPAAVFLSGLVASYGGPPQFGVCQSAAPWVIDYANGTQTSYVAVNTGLASVLFQIAPPSHASIVGSVVAPLTNNPGSQCQGPVIAHVNALDPTSGAFVNEVVFIETPLGVMSFLYSVVAVVPAA